MARTDFFDDPAAPRPNSLVVATSAVVTDEEGRILLQRRTEVRFVSPGELERLPLHPTQRLRLAHYLECREQPYLG